MKKTRSKKIVHTAWPLLVLALLLLAAGRIFTSRKVDITNVSCRAECGTFVVTFHARNLTDSYIRATVNMVVTTPIPHGKGITTWDPVGAQHMTFTLRPLENSEFSDQIPEVRMVTLGKVGMKEYRADVQVLAVESSKDAFMD